MKTGVPISSKFDEKLESEVLFKDHKSTLIFHPSNNIYPLTKPSPSLLDALKDQHLKSKIKPRG